MDDPLRMYLPAGMPHKARSPCRPFLYLCFSASASETRLADICGTALVTGHVLSDVALQQNEPVAPRPFLEYKEAVPAQVALRGQARRSCNILKKNQRLTRTL